MNRNTDNENTYNIFKDLRDETKLSFSIVQKEGPIVKSEIMTKSDMTLSTLNRVMFPIEDSQLVVDIGEADSTGGRRAHLYDVNRISPVFVGIELSRIFVRVAIVNLKIEVIMNDNFSIDGLTPDEVAERCNSIVECMLEELELKKSDIKAVGIGSSGKLDRETGTIISAINFPPNWDNVCITDKFANYFDCPIFLDNGAHAAVVAEYLFGSATGYDYVAYFHVGTGIKTGVINSGKLIRAINDKDDAFGHMIVDIHGDECTCGNRGCIEATSSLSAIMKHFKQAIEEGRECTIDKPITDITYQDICFAAEQGDALCEEIITTAGEYFGVGLANYINLMNPHCVILSGPLVSYSPLFFRISTTIAMEKCSMTDQNEIMFRRGCRYKDDVVVAGIAAIILEQWLETGLVG